MCFLLSPGASYISGASLDITGGGSQIEEPISILKGNNYAVISLL